MNTDPTSAAQAIAARADLEAEYLGIVREEIEAFMARAERQAEEALDRGSLMPLALLAALWLAAGDRVEQRLPAGSAAVQAFRDSPLPEVVEQAASAQVSLAISSRMSRQEALLSVRSVLGLERTVPEGLVGEYGRVTVPDVLGTGSTRSWESEGLTTARTGATADLASATLEQLRAEGFTHKRWSNRFDSRVRDTHVAADRQTVLLEEQFVVGSARLRFPGDVMAGAPEETINCRCVLIGVRFGRRPLDHPEGTEPWNNPRPL